MNNNSRDDDNYNDRTGEILSWVITFIFLFAFWPVGLYLLFRKLRGYEKPGQQSNKQRSEYTYIHTGTRTAAHANTQSGVQSNQQAYVQAPSHSLNRNSKRHPLLKKSGKFISVVLLILSVILVFIGLVGGLIGTVSSIVSGAVDWNGLILSTFFLFGGIGTFLSRNIVAHRYSRYKNYYAFIEGHGVVPLSNLVQISGKSLNAVKRDLQAMINNGFLETGTYIDNELGCLVLSAEEARKLRMEITDSLEDTHDSDNAKRNQSVAILAELRVEKSFIKDDVISAKVQRLEELTAKIFQITEESPEKLPQLKRFTSYYLPTTLKLVRSYVTLEKQGIKGENIMSTKRSIGDILDTLTTGFEQQLDQLFKSDAIDIASDINVLENLMQQDGLTGDKSEFRVTTGL